MNMDDREAPRSSEQASEVWAESNLQTILGNDIMTSHPEEHTSTRKLN